MRSRASKMSVVGFVRAASGPSGSGAWNVNLGGTPVGGSSLLVNFDNMKTAMLKADWFDPEINPKLADFGRRYGMHVVPCRPRDAATQGVGFIVRLTLFAPRRLTLAQPLRDARACLARSLGTLLARGLKGMPDRRANFGCSTLLVASPTSFHFKRRKRSGTLEKG